MIKVSPTTKTISAGIEGGCSPRATCSAVPVGMVISISFGVRAVSLRKIKDTSLIKTPNAIPVNIDKPSLLIIIEIISDSNRDTRLSGTLKHEDHFKCLPGPKLPGKTNQHHMQPAGL